MEQLTLFDLPTRTDQSVVYFARKNGAVKIGWTHNLERRMQELKATATAVIPGDRDTEAWMHRRFAESRICHEWFGPTPQVLDFIDHLRASG